jgi:hypothetical protein
MGFYQMARSRGRTVTAHRAVVEDALGKPLPAGAVIHHVDGNGLNNRPSNLVVCQDQEYHRLLHRRAKALKACGNPTWRRCSKCGKWSPPEDGADNKTGTNYRWLHHACVLSRKRGGKRPGAGRPRGSSSTASLVGKKIYLSQAQWDYLAKWDPEGKPGHQVSCVVDRAQSFWQTPEQLAKWEGQA